MRVIDQRLFLIGFVLGAVSCATYQPRPLDPAARAAELMERRIDDAGLAAFASRNGVSWPPKALDLDALTVAAFYYHPDLDIARAAYGISRAGMITAAARPNPSVSLGVQHASPSESKSPWTLGFNFDVPVEMAGKRGYRVRRARALAESDRLAISALAWQVRSRLRSAVVDFANTTADVALLEKQEEIQRDLVEILQKRLSFGEGSLLEATQARISAAQTALQLRDAQRRRGEARARIAEAVGIPAEALDAESIVFSIRRELPAIDELARTSLRIDALTGRADIEARLAEYAAADAALRLEIANQYPDLHLGPGFSWDQGVRKWSLGLSALLPILNQNQGPIAEAEARRREVAARVDALQAKVIADLDRSLAGYGGSVAKFEAARSLLSASEQNEAVVRRRLEAGETDRLDLRTSELQTNTSALALLDAETAVQQALGRIEDALQRPMTSTGVPASIAISREGEKEKP